MNYKQHYNLLIERARSRDKIDGYVERHHVIPKCLGGSDNSENIVELTAREHYVAHQLLVKMNPKHHGLIYAATMLTRGLNGNRINNRKYEWLKIRFSKSQSEFAKSQGLGKYGLIYGKISGDKNAESGRIQALRPIATAAAIEWRKQNKEKASEIGRKAGAATAKKIKDDPSCWTEIASRGGKIAGKMVSSLRYTCSECGVKLSPANLCKHQKRYNHVGVLK